MLDEVDLSQAADPGAADPARMDEGRSRREAGAASRAPAKVWPAVAAGCAAAVSLALGPLVSWIRWGGWGLLAAGAAYSTLLFAVGRRLWRGPRAEVGGVLVAAAALMVPFTVHGLEHAIGLFAEEAVPPVAIGAFVRDPTFLVDAAAVGALAVALRWFPFPPLAALLVAAAWVLSMDGAPVAFGDSTTWSQRALLSSAVGVGAIAVGAVVDRRTRGDFAGWLYRAGLFALCGGLLTAGAATGAVVLVRVVIALALVPVGLLLRRRVFAVSGALTAAGAGGLLADGLDGAALLAFALGTAAAVAAGGAAYASAERALARRPPGRR